MWFNRIEKQTPKDINQAALDFLTIPLFVLAVGICMIGAASAFVCGWMLVDMIRFFIG